MQDALLPRQFSKELVGAFAGVCEADQRCAGKSIWLVFYFPFLDKMPDRVVTLLSHVLELDSVPSSQGPNDCARGVNDRIREGQTKR